MASRFSPCSTALTSRLRRIRSTRRLSTSAMHGSAGSRNSILVPRRSASCWATSADCLAMSHTSTGSASRVAALASYRLISSRSVSSDSNRSSWLWSSSADRAGGASQVLSREQHVGGDPDRGQRSAQLVGDVRDELALHPGQVLQLAQLLLEAGGHLVERVGQRGQVVGAADLHALVQVAGGQAQRAVRGLPDRGDHPPGHQPGDRRQQEHDGHADQQQGVLGLGQAGLLGGQREEVVELVARCRRRHRRPGRARAGGRPWSWSSARPTGGPPSCWSGPGWRAAAARPARTPRSGRRCTRGRPGTDGQRDHDRVVPARLPARRLELEMRHVPHQLAPRPGVTPRRGCPRPPKADRADVVGRLLLAAR